MIGNLSPTHTERKSSTVNEEEKEQLLEEIRQRFLQLPFDNKITLVNWCKDFINNERKGSIPFNLEEDYLNSIARKQSILQSVMHIAPLLPWFVIVCIVVSTFSSSLMIPFLKLITCDSPYLITAWRGLINILFCLPLMIKEVRKHREGVKKLFSFKNVLTILLCQVFSVLQMFCQMIAMKVTYSSHVLLFSGMASIVLFFWKIIKRLPVTSMEIIGIIIALLGAAVISKGSGSSDGGYTPHEIVMGDLISFLGSVFGAFNFQILAPLLQFYHTGIYIVISNAWVAILGISTAIFSGFSLTLGFNAHTGIFGFLNGENILMSLFGLGIVGAYGALITLLISLKYLSPMIVALTALVQPMIAQLFATLIGLEGFPGMSTVIGGGIVLAGLFIVSQSSPVETPRKASLRAMSMTDPLLLAERESVLDSLGKQ